ncbi:hypothetical protein Tco_0830448 [Tanacetum coccineum]
MIVWYSKDPLCRCWAESKSGLFSNLRRRFVMKVLMLVKIRYLGRTLGLLEFEDCDGLKIHLGLMLVSGSWFRSLTAYDVFVPEVVKVAKLYGLYTWHGCIKDIMSIIESGEFEVKRLNFMSLNVQRPRPKGQKDLGKELCDKYKSESLWVLQETKKGWLTREDLVHMGSYSFSVGVALRESEYFVIFEVEFAMVRFYFLKEEVAGLVMRLLIREIARIGGPFNVRRISTRFHQGIMVNGTWVDDPVQVKREFFDHFQGRVDYGVTLKMGWLKRWLLNLGVLVLKISIYLFGYGKIGGHMSEGKPSLERKGGQGGISFFLDGR